MDESALGLGKLLASTRDDVIYAGHPDLPEVPLGTIDVGWMPIVAERNWVAIRRDRRIHTRPLEVRVFSEVGLRTVWLGGKKDMGSHQQLDLVIRHWQALEEQIPAVSAVAVRISLNLYSRAGVYRSGRRLRGNRRRSISLESDCCLAGTFQCAEQNTWYISERNGGMLSVHNSAQPT